MSRVIKFRGKSLITVEELDRMEIKHDNGWVYGNLISNGKSPLIVGDIAEATDEYINHDWWVKVDPESVGQFTGILDKNGVEIYEDDVIIIDHGSGHEWRERVIYHRGCFMANDDNLLVNVVDYATVIGNIYEDPHLLEVSQ